MVWFLFREIYDTDGSPDIFRWVVEKNKILPFVIFAPLFSLPL